MSNGRARLALASCRDLPDWEVDDQPFHAALSSRGIAFERPAWDDPEVDWSEFEIVLIRTTWDYAERCEAFVAWAESVATKTRLFNSPRVIRWNTDKHYLEQLEAHGMRLVPTVWLEKGSRVSIETEMKALNATRGFIKPMVGASARETLRFENTAEGLEAARRHCERLLQSEALMLQPYQASVETEGEYSVLFFDGQPSHGVRKVPVPGDYRVQDDYGASDYPEPLGPELVEPAKRAMALAETILGIGAGGLLYGRVDFLRDDEGVLCLNELELVEPSLFFRHDPASPHRLAAAIERRLSGD